MAMQYKDGKIVAENSHGCVLIMAYRSDQSWPGVACALGKAGLWFGHDHGNNYRAHYEGRYSVKDFIRNRPDLELEIC